MSIFNQEETAMAIEGVDPYFSVPPASAPPVEETPPQETEREREVITEESTGNEIDTTA
jgi:hypothetical protein